MQLSEVAPASGQQGLQQCMAARPVLWALLLSCGVHSVLLQTLLFKTTQPAVVPAKVLQVRWIDPPPPMQRPEETVNNTSNPHPPNPRNSAQATTKTRAKTVPQPTSRSEAFSAANAPPAVETPTTQASADAGTAPNSRPQTAPSPPTGTSSSPHTETMPNGAEPSQPKQRAALDLSQASLARAVAHANAYSLANKARVHIGLEPEPQDRVFAKRIASAAIPGCLSSSTDGEGQPSAGPSGNILYLPIMARDAILGKCKVLP